MAINQVMPNGTRQYVGARYVPIFADPVDWDNIRNYEPLTMVRYNGDIYITRQRVPAGTDISDTKYWIVLVNFSGQIDSLISIVNALDVRVGSLEDKQSANDVAIATLQAALNATNTNVAKNATDITALTKKVNDNETDIEAKVAALSSTVSSNNTAQTNAIAALTTTVNGHTTDITTIKDQVAALQSSLVGSPDIYIVDNNNPDAQYKVISEALSEIKAGQNPATILVMPGTYNEDLQEANLSQTPFTMVGIGFVRVRTTNPTIFNLPLNGKFYNIIFEAPYPLMYTNTTSLSQPNDTRFIDCNFIGTTRIDTTIRGDTLVFYRCHFSNVYGNVAMFIGEHATVENTRQDHLYFIDCLFESGTDGTAPLCVGIAYDTATTKIKNYLDFQSCSFFPAKVKFKQGASSTDYTKYTLTYPTSANFSYDRCYNNNVSVLNIGTAYTALVNYSTFGYVIKETNNTQTLNIIALVNQEYPDSIYSYSLKDNKVKITFPNGRDTEVQIQSVIVDKGQIKMTLSNLTLIYAEQNMTQVLCEYSFYLTIK